MKCPNCNHEMLPTGSGDYYCPVIGCSSPTPTSPTPRTDAMAFDVTDEGNIRQRKDGAYCSSDDARQLETSLIKAQQENERLREELLVKALNEQTAHAATKLQLTQLHEIAKGLAEALKQPYPADGSKDEAALTAYEDFVKENK